MQPDEMIAVYLLGVVLYFCFLVIAVAYTDNKSNFTMLEVFIESIFWFLSVPIVVTKVMIKRFKS